MWLKCQQCGESFRYQGERDRAECHNCGAGVYIPYGRIRRLRENESIRALADGPEVSLKNPPGSDIARSLKAPRQGSGGNKGRGTKRPIVYLPGDEREAMRVFIEENEDYVRGCVKDTLGGGAGGQNPLRLNWDDWTWNLLVEQWLWQGYDD